MHGCPQTKVCQCKEGVIRIRCAGSFQGNDFPADPIPTPQHTVLSFPLTTTPSPELLIVPGTHKEQA
eukprot:scaffold128189_cov22-Tisochrysis_lutea.AAC.1